MSIDWDGEGKPSAGTICEWIAAQEREKFISEICGLLGWDASLEYSRHDAIKLFDDGYRKQ